MFRWLARFLKDFDDALDWGDEPDLDAVVAG